MCGIAGFYEKRPNKISYERLADALTRAIDHRGGDATGLAAFGATGLLGIEKASCRAHTFIAGRGNLPEGTKYVLIHTRLATQGGAAFPKNNHPVVSGDVFVTHNGHVFNDYSLWQELGWENRTAEVDSEVIPAVIAADGWESTGKALERIEGSMAIAAAHSGYPGELILARGYSSPIHIIETADLLVWASTGEALLTAWAASIGTPPKKRLRRFDEGTLIHVKDGELTYSKFKVQKATFTWANYDTDGTGSKGKNSGKASASKRTGGNSGNVTVVTPPRVTTRIGTQWGTLTEADAEELTAELTEEMDAAKHRAGLIQEMPEWFHDVELLKEFNSCWDVVRENRKEIEDLVWAVIQAKEDKESELVVMHQCGSCFEMYERDELNDEMDELYCQSCVDYFSQGMIGTGHHPRVTFKAIEGDFDEQGNEMLYDTDGSPLYDDMHLANLGREITSGNYSVPGDEE